MSVTNQGKFALFSANVGSRLAWLREKRGVTLGKLADGSPSTAQSWIEGKTPRREKWRGIASRLGLSESLIFVGRPDSAEDYEFIVTHREEIEGADRFIHQIDTRAQTGGPPVLHTMEERPSPRSAAMYDRLRAQDNRPSSQEDCEAYIRRYFEEARKNGDPNNFPAIMQKLRRQFPLDEFNPREEGK